MNKYSETVMRRCRMCFDLEADDTSKDDIFNDLSPKEALAYCLQWEGIIGYEDDIVGFVEDCYNINLED